MAKHGPCMSLLRWGLVFWIRQILCVGVGHSSPSTVALNGGNSFAVGSGHAPSPLSAEAIVLPGTGEGFKDGLSAELLRFVTAYGRGFETLVDLTPYSPLLRTASDVADHVSVYSFIDTWVDNSSGQDALYVSNTTGKCTAEHSSHGNGWTLDAELLFWPESEDLEEVDTRPFASVTLAAGPMGGHYSIGATGVHEGRMSAQGMVVLDEATNLEHILRAHVYDCAGQEEIVQAAVFGHTLMEVTAAALKDKRQWIEFIEDRFFTYLALPHLHQVAVVAVEGDKHIVRGTYDARILDIKPGTSVFLSPFDAFTDKLYGTSFWSNSSYPLKPVGSVVEATHLCKPTQETDKCIGQVTLHLNNLDSSCFLHMGYLDFPGLFVPDHAQALTHAKDLARSMRNEGEAAARRQRAVSGRVQVEEGPLLLNMGESSFFPKPSRGMINLEALLPSAAESRLGAISLLHEHENFGHPSGQPNSIKKAYGHMESPLEALAPKSETAATSPVIGLNAAQLRGKRVNRQLESNRVCVVTQRRQGRFLEKQFDMPAFDAGKDRIIMQLAITGHGWEATTEGCGEYCHALYQLGINQQSAANITQWRDDCSVNPLGEQHGTWKTARNGWCPGSVQPGLFVDVTNWLKKGSNVLTLDLAVRSSITGALGPYIDHSGFSNHESAILNVAATLFVYSQAAVSSIRAQSHALTPAEQALREGSSEPKALVSAAAAAPDSVEASQLQPDAFGEIQDSVSPYFDRLLAKGVRGSGFSGAFHRRRSTMSDHSPIAPKRNVDEARDNPTSITDFQARAPWHILDEKSKPLLEDAHRVSVFSGILVQGQTRWNTAAIPRAAMPKAWRSAALRLRLSEPPSGLTVDAWDRVGSIGVHIKEGDSKQFRTHGHEQASAQPLAQKLHMVSS